MGFKWKERFEIQFDEILMKQYKRKQNMIIAAEILNKATE